MSVFYAVHAASATTGPCMGSPAGSEEFEPRSLGNTASCASSLNSTVRSVGRPAVVARLGGTRTASLQVPPQSEVRRDSSSTSSSMASSVIIPAQQPPRSAYNERSPGVRVSNDPYKRYESCAAAPVLSMPEATCPPPNTWYTPQAAPTRGKHAAGATSTTACGAPRRQGHLVPPPSPPESAYHPSPFADSCDSRTMSFPPTPFMHSVSDLSAPQPNLAGACPGTDVAAPHASSFVLPRPLPSGPTSLDAIDLDDTDGASTAMYATSARGQLGYCKSTNFIPPPPVTGRLFFELDDEPAEVAMAACYAIGSRWADRLERWLQAHPKHRPYAPQPAASDYPTPQAWLDKLNAWYLAHFVGRKVRARRQKGGQGR